MKHARNRFSCVSCGSFRHFNDVFQRLRFREIDIFLSLKYCHTPGRLGGLLVVGNLEAVYNSEVMSSNLSRDNLTELTK